MFFKRLLSSLALWALILGLIFSGWETGSWLVMVFFGIIAQWEFYCAQEEKGVRVLKWSGTLGGYFLYLLSWLFLIQLPEHAEMLPVAQGILFAVLIVGTLLRLVFARDHFETPIGTVAITLFGFLYVPYLFNFINLTAFGLPGLEHGHIVLFYLLAVTKFSDIGAYIVGMKFGRTKMAPLVSPKKTWEGFVGGVGASLVVSLTMVHFFVEQLPPLGWVHGVILGVLLPLVSVVGDLAESIIKRDAHIKDSGNSIPGIGGALDLIDSILFTAPVLYFYLYFGFVMA